MNIYLLNVLSLIRLLYGSINNGDGLLIKRKRREEEVGQTDKWQILFSVINSVFDKIKDQTMQRTRRVEAESRD